MGLKPRRTRKYTVEDRVLFLNVDLELESPSDLGPLVDALGQVYVLHRSSEAPFVAALELDSDVGLDLEATLVGLLQLVEKLDVRARDRWDRCTVRRFDIGIQSGLGPHCSQYALPASVLARLNAVRADVVLTVYGARYESST